MNINMLLKLFLLITILGYSLNVFAEDSELNQLHIQLPKNIDTQNMSYIYRNCHVNYLGNRGSKEQWDYYIDMGICSNTKLILYVPGYEIITYEFEDNDLINGINWQPPLKRLSRTEILTGRIVDSNNIPIANELIRINYHFREVMRYYGYGDGAVAELYIGQCKTNSNGEFVVEVPSLMDDPFILKYNGPGHYSFDILDYKNQDTKHKSIEIFDPFFVEVKSAHEKPLTLRLRNPEYIEDVITF